MHSDSIFDGVKWVSYQQAVDSVTKIDDCYELLQCLLEAAQQTANPSLFRPIKALVEKIFHEDTF